MNSKQLNVFAQAIVNTGKCNNVVAVLDDYDSQSDSFYVYKSDYELFKEVVRELSKALKN